MAKPNTLPWDAAEHLETEEDMAAYLEAALEDGDSSLVAAALGDIARAKGMTEIARETGLGRESVQGAISRRESRILDDTQGDPRLGPASACDNGDWRGLISFDPD